MANKSIAAFAVFENIGGTRDIVLHYAGGGSDSVTGINVSEANYLVELLRNEKPIFYDHALKRLSTGLWEPVGGDELAPDLDAWLNAHPDVASRIVWEDGSAAHSWLSWPAPWKSQLREAFDLAWIRSSILVADVPENRMTLDDDDFAATLVSAADAWAYFRASVAQSLAMEIGQWHPWSLLSYTADQLAELIDSRMMFYWSPSPEGYRIDSMHGRVVPGLPTRSYSFLATHELIGATCLETMARLLDWCRAKLVHFSGGTTAGSMEDQWQYRGFPPVSRIIEGTVRKSQPTLGAAHRTAGCWGTTGFLRALLRSVNVPVKLVRNAGHAQPWFMADSCYLSHGDDPYTALSKASPPMPTTELLINQATFEAWFGSEVSTTEKEKNIGRRPRECAVEYLPNYLLRKHCSDLAAGRGHAESEAAEILAPNFTIADLEAQNLWGRMESKIASFGGCAHVP